ncbi:MAG: HAMP domain-containing histidine kinase [Eubacterium sp.]|nr:HAMP domain-containing histidine kinase [Eubacterium sp.]
MIKSMRTRLIMISASMVMFVIIFFCLSNAFMLPNFYQSTKVGQMKRLYTQTASICGDVDWTNLSDEDENDIYDKLDTLGSGSNVNIYIMQVEAYSTSGEIATLNYVYPASSERLQEVTREQLGKYVKEMYFGQKLDDNCQILSKTKNCAVYKVYDERVESNYIELTGRLPNDYWVYVRSNYQSIAESTAVSNRFMLYVGMIVTFLGMFIMLFVSNQYTKPILQLARHAENMKKLNFSNRYTGNRTDEIGILGNSMNALSDKLEETISELKTANNELQLDLERRTEQEEMRQEFLANVSHELKTPIALIQGYAEGLQDNINDDPESREFYCEVIVDEANKMNKMVKKLLSLNQLEFGNGSVHFEHFDLRDVIRQVTNSTEILFRQKEVTLSYQEPDEPLMVWADEYMMEEVVTNYVSNALNHVKYDNIIEIKTIADGDVVRVSVFNTGDPIPDEDIDKIWDKFYKVDKAHTRAYGGNGIGLSIVKAIMGAHNQNYGVKNYDNGVEFWFEVDQKNTVDKKSVD